MDTSHGKFNCELIETGGLFAVPIVNKTMHIARRLLVVAMLLAWGAACAQGRTVRLVVAFPPGAANDTIARALAEHMREPLGQPMIVENRPGAGGQVAVEHVARAAPDGTTLIVGNIATHGTLPALRKLAVDPISDFTPVAMIGTSPLALAASATLPLRTPADVVALAKSRPEGLFFGSAGIGTGSHLAGLILAKLAGIRLEHVPYPGSAAAYVAVSSGEVALLFEAAAVKTLVDSGKVRAIAITGNERWFLMPEVPTFAERGIGPFPMLSWFGLIGPAGMSAETLSRTEAAASAAIAKPEMRQALMKIGFTPSTMSRAAFGQFMREDLARWRAVVAENNLKAE